MNPNSRIATIATSLPLPIATKTLTGNRGANHALMSMHRNVPNVGKHSPPMTCLPGPMMSFIAKLANRSDSQHATDATFSSDRMR